MHRPPHSTFYILHSDRGGQMLVEMLVAISLLTIALLSGLTLLSRAIGLNRTITDNYVATYLAGEGIELVKNFIDANVIQGGIWNCLPGACGISGRYRASWDSIALVPYPINVSLPLRFDPVAHTYDYVGPQTTKFYRAINITFVGNCEIAVSSTMTWTGAGGTNLSMLVEDHFYDWRASSPPPQPAC